MHTGRVSGLTVLLQILAEHESLVPWIQNYLTEMLLLVPLPAFLKSCFIAGLFISGIFLFTTCAIIYGQGDVNLATIVTLAFMGALAGDHTGYILSYTAAPKLWQSRWIRRELVRRKAAFRLFNRLLKDSALWAICIGRLIPAIRSISPAAAGIAGIKPMQFLAYDLLACTIWATGLSFLLLSVNHQF
jgi:membrane-associated protein